MFSLAKVLHVSEANTVYGPGEASVRGQRRIQLEGIRLGRTSGCEAFEKSRLTVALLIHPIAWYQTVLTHTQAFAHSHFAVPAQFLGSVRTHILSFW
jgi:hypothetical protein